MEREKGEKTINKPFDTQHVREQKNAAVQRMALQAAAALRNVQIVP